MSSDDVLFDYTKWSVYLYTTQFKHFKQLNILLVGSPATVPCLSFTVEEKPFHFWSFVRMNEWKTNRGKQSGNSIYRMNPMGPKLS